MTKPKILFVLHLPPPMHGAAMMGNYLKQSEVINSEFETSFINLGTNKILSQSGKGSFKKIFTFGSIIRNLVSVLRKNKFDLCYMTLTASGAGFYKDALLVSIIKRRNKNIVYHFHNKGVSLPKNKLADSIYRYVFRDTKSILLSRHLYPDIQQYVNEKNVFYCPNGIPSTDGGTRKQRDNNASCKLLFLSNIMREKGVFTLLEACRIMKRDSRRFSCHFVGGWANITEHEFKEEVAKLDLSDTVYSYGPKYGADKETFYRDMDVFVFPTFYDVFPLVCLEAMQHSMVIVSTPEGGIPEIVIDGETGFLVPQHDATSLAQKLTVLIEDQALRKNMQAAGKKRFDELFTLAHWERNMSGILKTAALAN